MCSHLNKLSDYCYHVALFLFLASFAMPVTPYRMSDDGRDLIWSIGYQTHLMIASGAIASLLDSVFLDRSLFYQDAFSEKGRGSPPLEMWKEARWNYFLRFLEELPVGISWWGVWVILIFRCRKWRLHQSMVKVLNTVYSVLLIASIPLFLLSFVDWNYIHSAYQLGLGLYTLLLSFLFLSISLFRWEFWERNGGRKEGAEL